MRKVGKAVTFHTSLTCDGFHLAGHDEVHGNAEKGTSIMAAPVSSEPEKKPRDPYHCFHLECSGLLIPFPAS